MTTKLERLEMDWNEAYKKFIDDPSDENYEILWTAYNILTIYIMALSDS